MDRPHRAPWLLLASLLLPPTLPLLAAPAAGAAPAASTPAGSTPRVALGYYGAFADLPVDQAPWSLLTHVAHAFLETDAKGRLAPSQDVPSLALTDAAHRRGVRALVSLGGADTLAGLRHVVADPARTTGYARGVAGLVAQHGYDGVDLAWEFPSNRAERAGFVALLTALRKELDARAAADKRGAPYLLTAVLPPSAYFGKWVDAGAVVGLVDWFNVQAYDMSDPWSREAAHHAPLFASREDPERSWRSVAHAMEYWRTERGVRPDKLVLGLPLYGRAMPVDEPYARLDPKRRADHEIVDFARVQSLAGEGWPAEWDKQTKVPWLRDPSGKGRVIAYDDRNSIFIKAAWARGEGYRGLYYWVLHQDRMPDGTHWLLRAAEKGWPRNGAAGNAGRGAGDDLASGAR